MRLRLRLKESTPTQTGSRVVLRLINQAVTGPRGADGGSMSGAAILAALLPVDGAGSGLDADLLDGNSSAAYATAAQGALADTAVQPAALASYQPLDTDLSTIAAANNGAVLAATTASFLSADRSKLDGIEAGADVTDATNVAAAGGVLSADVDVIATITQAAYDALSPPVATTLYVITG